VTDCFHCGAPIPLGIDLSLVVEGHRRPVCCPGCLAVAALIDEHGLARFYDFRSVPNRRPKMPSGEQSPFAVCDRPEVVRQLVTSLDAGRQELRCQVEGVTCAACVWLLERGVRGLPGVEDVSVNPVSGETSVRFDSANVKLGAILDAIASFGFEPRPRFIGASHRRQTEDARDELRRLAVAGLGSAHVMTLAVALYVGAFRNIETTYATFFMLVSMLIATPVVLYSGAPIFRAAWRDVRRRRIGMDVPVALAIAIALGASLVNAFRGVDPVYFDSATMFVFFLSLGRFFESRARHRAGSLFDALADLRPLSATRVRAGVHERVGTIELVVGDEVVVAPGEAVPADGTLVSAFGTFDESLLSGESAGRRRTGGESVLGGSLNAGHAPVEVRVARLGADSYVERVGGLLHRALAERPEFLRLADRWAGGFSAAVLALAAVAGATWLALAPDRALGVVLAVLVVACPCALSLAAPTAFAVALGRLARRGLLLRSARALERVGDVTTWLFDKTGTLTEGRIVVAHVETFGGLGAESCLAVAAALECAIEHPIARALRTQRVVAPATQIDYRPGYGVSGVVDGQRYRLGSARHVGFAADAGIAGQRVYLAGEEGVLARIDLADTLRPHAREALAALGAAGREVMLVSGDEIDAVARAARELGVVRFAGAQAPDDKLALLRERQSAGAVVAAVGDGINDAPLLAQADVSIALVAGSQLAQASADVVFTGTDLRVLARLPGWAGAVRRVVRQNLVWAAAYNFAAVPLAAVGVLTPWMAAVGMSLSSVLVVANALRLHRVLADGAATSTLTRRVLEERVAA
jgi:Cu2+-exporting ATPase